MAKRSWTPEEKERFIQEAKIHKVSEVLRKNNLSSSLFYTWKQRYKAYGLKGLQPSSRVKDEKGVILKELIQEKGNIQYLEEKVKLFEELLSLMSLSEIPITERAALVRKYNKRGLHLIILFDICRISKRRYYLEINNLK